MIKRLEWYLALRFIRYFFLCYIVLVGLYAAIDFCEKKIRVVSSLDQYIKYHFLFLLFDRLPFVLYVALFFWLCSLVGSAEAERLLLVHVSLLDRVKIVVGIIFFIACLGGLAQTAWGEHVCQKRQMHREALVYKKKKAVIIWKRVESGFVRLVDGVIDRVVRIDRQEGLEDIASEVDISFEKEDLCIPKKQSSMLFSWGLFFMNVCTIFVQPACTVALFWMALEEGFFLWYAGVGLYCLFQLGYLFFALDEIAQKVWIFVWMVAVFVLYGYLFVGRSLREK